MRKGGEVMGKSALTRQNVESDKFTLVYTVVDKPIKVYLFVWLKKEKIKQDKNDCPLKFILVSVNIPVFTLSSTFFPVNRCCEMSSYLMITRVFYSSLFFRASFYLISFFDKIFHFSIIDGNKTEIDLVLMQAFLFSSVNYFVRIFNGKKWRQRKAAL